MTTSIDFIEPDASIYNYIKHVKMFQLEYSRGLQMMRMLQSYI